MPQNCTIYKVLISSPSDVRSHARSVAGLLKEWSETEGKRRHIVIEPAMWETHAIPEMGDRPQNIINRQLVDNSDLDIALFGTRFGTPTDDYASGTVEEIERSLTQGKPVSVYFSHVLIDPGTLDLEQYAKLQEYERSCSSRGLHCSYANLIELRKHIKTHVPERVLRLHEQYKKNNHDGISQSNQSDIKPQRVKHVSPDKTPFDQLTKKERNYWFAQAVKYMSEHGVLEITDNKTLHMGQALYRQSLRTFEDLKAEALGVFRRNVHVKEDGDIISRLASRRLPNNDDPKKKK